MRDAMFAAGRAVSAFVAERIVPLISRDPPLLPFTDVDHAQSARLREAFDCAYHAPQSWNVEWIGRRGRLHCQTWHNIDYELCLKRATLIADRWGIDLFTITAADAPPMRDDLGASLPEAKSHVELV